MRRDTRKRTVIGPSYSRDEYLSNSGLWLPVFNILVVRDRGDERDLFYAENIVTNDGDLHYAQRIVSETLTNDYDTLELGSAMASGHPSKTSNRSNMTQIGSTQKAVTTNYPTRNDSDGDNTGAGTDIVSWAFSYTKGDFNATGITHGLITNSTPGTSESCLTTFAFGASFDKTADDTLKVFVNHTVNGV